MIEDKSYKQLKTILRIECNRQNTNADRKTLQNLPL